MSILPVNKLSCAVFILALSVSPVRGSEPLGLSNSLSQMYQDRVTDLERLASDPRARERLLINSYGHAIHDSGADNRAYLFALAFDLYNSLPPGPPVHVLNEHAEAGNPLTDASRKAELYSELQSAFEPVDAGKRKSWDWVLNHRDRDRLLELYYLRTYLHQSPVMLDKWDEQASIPPQQLDLQTPTHYAELKAWMEKTEVLREQGVPPWEAIKRFPAPVEAAIPETAATGRVPTTSPAPAEPDQTSPAPVEPSQPEATGGTQAPAEPSEDAATSRPWWIAGVAVIFVLAAAWYLRRRKAS